MLLNGLEQWFSKCHGMEGILAGAAPASIPAPQVRAKLLLIFFTGALQESL